MGVNLPSHPKEKNRDEVPISEKKNSEENVLTREKRKTRSWILTILICTFHLPLLLG
jgi:hypothetical protein